MEVFLGAQEVVVPCVWVCGLIDLNAVHAVNGLPVRPTERPLVLAVVGAMATLYGIGAHREFLCIVIDLLVYHFTRSADHGGESDSEPPHQSNKSIAFNKHRTPPNII
jgi:hypothetical protein